MPAQCDEISTGRMSATLPPGQSFAAALQTFKLQLPVSNGKGSVQEIKQPALMTYVSQYFYRDPTDGAMVFSCPDDGAHTPGSDFPRSELRDNEEWRIASTHSMTGSVKILQPPRSGKIIFAQIHGQSKGTEALKLRWTNGSVVASIKEGLGGRDVNLPVVSGLHPGDLITFSIAEADHHLTVTVNGKSVAGFFNSSWDDERLYFKAGNYLQDNTRSGSVGKVAYYSLTRQ
jgi:hypothetical protein